MVILVREAVHEVNSSTGVSVNGPLGCGNSVSEGAHQVSSSTDVSLNGSLGCSDPH